MQDIHKEESNKTYGFPDSIAPASLHAHVCSIVIAVYKINKTRKGKLLK